VNSGNDLPGLTHLVRGDIVDRDIESPTDDSSRTEYDSLQLTFGKPSDIARATILYPDLTHDSRLVDVSEIVNRVTAYLAVGNTDGSAT
jgi:hypothetical protein